MLPNRVDSEIKKTIDEYSAGTLGCKLSGAGGGGYLIFVSEKPVKNALQIKIRRPSFKV